ncbi:hypothetical protein OROGR_012724 [Orobanche gracilis]
MIVGHGCTNDDCIPAAGSCYYFAQEEEEEEEEEEETTKLPPEELYNNLPLLHATDPAYCDLDTFFASPDDMLSFPEDYCNSLQQQLPYNNTVSSSEQYYYSTDDQDIIHEYQPQQRIMIPTLPDFSTGPPAYSSGIVAWATTETGAGGGGGSSSPSDQSIAARHRRKKISDKTHELGKLIPGAQKMNTEC